VGCGSGATNLALADQLPDSELVGIDLSDPLLEMAREAARKGRLADRVRFEKADVMEIPYEGGSFDVVLNLNMVHLVEDPPRMLSEIARVLRPGGFLFLADLKRSMLGVFEKEIRSALSCSEARELIRGSALVGGSFHAGLLWWRYERLPLRSDDQYRGPDRSPRPGSPFEDT
jgi:ubiquinone/menaquinone biosynthesis C-methylase UbiE